ncbi:ABC transporter substrate-binding protein [Spirilliplanes yamanashiensis]|uniref:ABC transporter substrate-binding protein n=1 Tax=Spirilliplanes yamanashiensis TaxID=42233 RepID=A0A8J3Y7S9_9ACTN|nr:extracellular solute-binding protein [Spirilliplanes yamanashiensis]MDP9817414.1 cellobiose transport system substrate-binding protein [Spirilliplanes yamanashiensis]GIJ02934.1 ABC transporter substrate-binding protein [Spirilliplanes yamanashiensis]
MRTSSRRGRVLSAAALAAVTALGMAACGGGDDDAGAAAPGGKVKLIVDTFGEFGYEQLAQDYMAANPNITVEIRGKGMTLDKYSPQLTQQLATGKGAGDVVAIEEGIMIEYKANPKNFVDLNQFGAAELKDNFLPWKWEAGLSADKAQVIGLGTDVGGMAMCYRKDLFSKAGLPTARDEVSALWPTWADYISTGQRFAAGNTGAAFVDSGTGIYNTILLQEAGKATGYTYYDTAEKLVVETNPVVKAAFDQTAQVIGAGLSGKYPQWSPEWTTAFKQAKFATIACPAWMTGVIEGNAGPSAKGKWDIARIPGEGGNWGGSHLAVPTQGKHHKEAYALAKFLTSKDGLIAAFKAKGTLPASAQALDDPAVKEYKNAYFSDAPVGAIFGEGAKALKPVYMGPKNQAIRTEVENAITQIDQGKADAAKGWQNAVANAKKAAAK